MSDIAARADICTDSFRVSFSIALLALLAGCGETELFQAPSRVVVTADLVSVPVVDSKVTLVARIPYDAMRQAIATKMPASMSFDGKGHIACVGVPHVNPGHVGSHQECVLGLCTDVPDFTGPSIGTTDQCADYNWHADVAKEGGFTIARAGEAVHLEQGLQVSGKAGVGGDLASLLSLSGKNFESHALPGVDLNFSMNDRWCPSVNVTPKGKWVSSASVEIVGKNCLGVNLGALGHPEVCAGPVNLGLSDILNSELEKHRDEIKNAVSKALPCDAIRAKIQQQWHPLSIQVGRGPDERLFLNIVPSRAGLSALIAEDNSVKLIVQVAAKMSAEPDSVKTEPLPLPPLGRATADQSAAILNLQVVAPYGLVKGEISKLLKGKDFQQQTPAGDIKIHVEDVDLYPSQTSIAIGLKISAKLPGRWFDTSGWVYLSGRPVAVISGKSVGIEDIQFSTVVDSDFWKVVEGLFQQQIVNLLRNHSKVDLTKLMEDASAKIVDAINKVDVPGLKIVPDKPSIELTDVHVGKENLIVGTRLGMNFDMEISAALIEK